MNLICRLRGSTAKLANGQSVGGGGGGGGSRIILMAARLLLQSADWPAPLLITCSWLNKRQLSLASRLAKQADAARAARSHHNSLGEQKVTQFLFTNLNVERSLHLADRRRRRLPSSQPALPWSIIMARSSARRKPEEKTRACRLLIFFSRGGVQSHTTRSAD